MAPKPVMKRPSSIQQGIGKGLGKGLGKAPVANAPTAVPPLPARVQCQEFGAFIAMQSSYIPEFEPIFNCGARSITPGDPCILVMCKECLSLLTGISPAEMGVGQVGVCSCQMALLPDGSQYWRHEYTMTWDDPAPLVHFQSAEYRVENDDAVEFPTGAVTMAFRP